MSIESMPDAALTLIEGLSLGTTTLEQITTDTALMPAVMVHSNDIPQVVKTYKSGQKVKQYSWSVFRRAVTGDSASRLAAQHVMDGVVASVESSDMALPDGCTHRSTHASSYPTLSDASETYETYSVSFITEYRTD